MSRGRGRRAGVPVNAHSHKLVRGLNPEPTGQRCSIDVTWNLPLDGGGLVVSREIRIEIELEAVLQA